MLKFSYLFIFVCFFSFSAFGQSFLSVPIEGTAGKDYTIVNYVDWQVLGIKDAFCGTKTYDGHEGTDFAIRSFRQMDSGVNVLAAADGEVVFIHDGEYDKNTEGDTSLHLGNYIAIRHSNRYFTYYGHLKKNSILVKLGDMVKSGKKMALVGSSGNSTDPHLHFEVYYDSAVLVDPFAGACGNPNSLWIKQPAYDTSFFVWESGLYAKTISLNDLRNRVSSIPCCPYQIKQNTDSPIYLWAQMAGVRKGSLLRINWYNPSDSLYFKYDIVPDRDYWYYYYYSYINNTGLTPGNWEVTLEYNGKVIVTQEFIITRESGIDESEKRIDNKCNTWFTASSLEWQNLAKENQIMIFAADGKAINANCISNGLQGMNTLPRGLYIIKIQDKKGRTCTLKKVVN